MKFKLLHHPRSYIRAHVIGMDRATQIVRRDILMQRDEDTKPLNL